VTTTMTYRLVAESRVSVGRGPEIVNSRSIQTIIPGSTVRGALASVWARQHEETWGAPSIRFKAIFERGLTVGQAVPERTSLQQMSMVRCKYPTRVDCDEAWLDLALLALSGADIPTGCRGCHGAWISGRGWELRPALEDEGERAQVVATTRAGLDEQGVAGRTEQGGEVDGNLFTRRALGKGTEFTGRVVVPKGLDEGVREWLMQPLALRVGGQRSVLGAVTWSAEEETGSTSETADRAVLTCLSPTIVVDEFGAPSMDALSDLQTALGSSSVKIEAQWTRTERIAGWHMASGLPKSEEWALAPGSTFVLTGLPLDALDKLSNGVGLRTNEGYGQLQHVRETQQASGGTGMAGEAASNTMRHTETVPESAPTVEQLKDRFERGGPIDPPQESSFGAVAAQSPEPEVAVDEGQRRVFTVLDALATLPQPSQRDTALRGVIGGISKVRLVRRNRLGSTMAEIRAADVLNLPWARLLPQEALDALSAILLDSDLDVLEQYHASFTRASEEGQR
jgi:CRISPR-associated protein Csx10